MSWTPEAYLAPSTVLHGSFVVRTLGGHPSGTVETSAGGAFNGGEVRCSSDGLIESGVSCQNTTGR